MVDGTKLGNLARVYHDLSANRAREDFIRGEDEKRGPFYAEVVDGRTGHWRALITSPNHETIAGAHLVGRGFGIFLPEYDEWNMATNDYVKRLLLPGYIFVFVWDVKRHARRLLTCPGVAGFLLCDDQPALVPWAWIDHLRAIENAERRPLMVKVEDVVKKKRWRQSRKIQREAQVDPDEIVRVSSYSANVVDLAEQRAQAVEECRSAFHKAMGLVA